MPTKRNENKRSRQPLGRHGHHGQKLEASESVRQQMTMVHPHGGAGPDHGRGEGLVLSLPPTASTAPAPTRTPRGKCLQQVIPETESGPVAPRDNGQGLWRGSFLA